jgi:hypothetical protein
MGARGKGKKGKREKGKKKGNAKWVETNSE